MPPRFRSMAASLITGVSWCSFANFYCFARRPAERHDNNESGRPNFSAPTLLSHPLLDHIVHRCRREPSVSALSSSVPPPPSAEGHRRHRCRRRRPCGRLSSVVAAVIGAAVYCRRFFLSLLLLILLLFISRGAPISFH